MYGRKRANCRLGRGKKSNRVRSEPCYQTSKGEKELEAKLLGGGEEIEGGKGSKGKGRSRIQEKKGEYI